MKLKVIGALFFMIILGNLHAQKGVIKLKVTNIECPKGTLYISLYNTSKNFLEEGAEYRKVKLKISKKEARCTIDELPQGEYAIAMYHDKNEDGECNRNWLGIPMEGYGFSRNFKPIVAPPSFKKVKIAVADETAVRVKMLNAK